MRTWGRVAAATYCGGCGVLIAAKDPALFIALPNVKRVRIRCQACEGAAPPDLPELVSDGAPPLSDMEPMQKLTQRFGGTIWKHNG